MSFRAPTLSLRLTDASALFAVVVPTLLAFNLPPSATFFNQAAALIGWGVFILMLGTQAVSPTLVIRRKMAWMLAPLAALALAAVVSNRSTGLPAALAASAVGVVLAGMLAVAAGASARESGFARDLFRGFCIALLVAGVAGAILGGIQIFMPEWADGSWIAAAPSDGRASSNLRQPNHLSSLLVWSLVALAWLWQSKTLRAELSATLWLVIVGAIVLTGSRTGIVDVIVLAIWGLLDRKLPRGLRAALIVSPLLYGAFWWGLTEWAHSTHHVFGGEARMGTQGDISSSRWAIWSDTLSLIRQHPWLGVGFGEFNFAWSLTPFPHRPVAFFDHTHNIVLQFAVELGIPAALLLTASLLVALFFAFEASLKTTQPMSSMMRAAFMVVLTICVHSMFEYPLWYSYFLLPAAFAFGFCLGGDGPPAIAESGDGQPASARANLILASLALLLLVGGTALLVDYRRVVAIFDSEDGEPLIDRIEAGRRSVFFSYHADYAAVTVSHKPSTVMLSFATATHNLLDTRLMIAWAKAFAERGDLERARHIAQRLREFRNEDSKDFFAVCEQPAAPRPFQCDAPTRAMDYRDFR
ncbi:MAG: O-antigen ligase C-terminal domain-containing protein [Burkholderiales bacterium]|jgi:O-antigen ligase|nr:O-antigen ligase C-terminal domain-containing protein [Burkholderiales bacterium]